MNLKEEIKPLSLIVIVFIGFYFLPMDMPRFTNAIMESLYLAKSYAQEHVILCLIPALFIAGGISVFLSSESVMKYLGANAKRIVAYSVAAVSGTILAVCSCTVLPLFGGIYKRGAGIGPASAFLYSGPAINVLAIVMTMRILGFEIGIARAIGAITFSVLIGLAMAFIFRKEEKEKQAATAGFIPGSEAHRPLYQIIIYFALMILILVFANWGKSMDTTGLWYTIYSSKWIITSIFAFLLGLVLVHWFKYPLLKIIIITIFTTLFVFLFPELPIIAFSAGFIGLAWAANTANSESEDWLDATWGFAKQIIPLLFYGVLVAGFLLGRPGTEGMIPSEWISSLVGGNSIFANFFASIVGAFMYFATLTEVPILQGLMASGMGKGPALALLLAGPALSLPSMLVLRSLMGTKKTVVFVSLVVGMATVTGMLYGWLF